MSFVGEQIKKYRNIKGMTQQDIADALGESSGRVIYNWEKGIGRPDCDKLARLCDLLEVSADELIGCKSMADRPTATEWNTIQKYRALDEHGKEIVDYLIDSEYKRIATLTRKPKPRMLKMDSIRSLHLRVPETSLTAIWQRSFSFPRVQKRNRLILLSPLEVTAWSRPITTEIRCLLRSAMLLMLARSVSSLSTVMFTSRSLVTSA